MFPCSETYNHTIYGLTSTIRFPFLVNPQSTYGIILFLVNPQSTSGTLLNLIFPFRCRCSIYGIHLPCNSPYYLPVFSIIIFNIPHSIVFHNLPFPVWFSNFRSEDQIAISNNYQFPFKYIPTSRTQ